MVDVVRAAGPLRRLPPRLVPAVVAALPLGLFAALLVLVQVRWAPLAALDRHVADGLHRVALRQHALVVTLKVVSTLGTSPVYLLVFAVVLSWLLRHRRAREAVFVAVAVVGGPFLNTLVKNAVDRPRPAFAQAVAHAGSSSFPSGHTQGVTVALGVLLVVVLPALPPAVRRWATAAGLTWALVIGFARLTLGVHYLSDVVAGYALGAGWVLLLCAAFGLLQPGGRRAVRAGHTKAITHTEPVTSE